VQVIPVDCVPYPLDELYHYEIKASKPNRHHQILKYKEQPFNLKLFYPYLENIVHQIKRQKVRTNTNNLDVSWIINIDESYLFAVEKQTARMYEIAIRNYW